jgi:hypothetical protein
VDRLLAATQRRVDRVDRLLAVVDRRVARPLAAGRRRVAIGVRGVAPTSIAARDPSAAIGMIARRVRR